MGAYNTITASVICPQCGANVKVVAQFKYGDTWQHSYRLLDKLKWGGNNIGEQGARRVVVDGIAEQPCSACGSEGEWDLYLYLEHDTFVAVETATGEHDFVAAGKTYFVLQE